MIPARQPSSYRTALFCSATRPDLIAKLGRTHPDLAVIDLEDAVAPDAKTEGRRLAREAGPALATEPDGPSVFLRINEVGAGMLADDLDALFPEAAGVVVPKVESPADIRKVRWALDQAGRPDALILGGVETAAGVEAAREIARAGLCAIYFGAEDFIGDVGGRRSRGNSEVLYARSVVVVAARGAEIPAMDQIVVDHTDLERMARETAEALDLGYTGKLCIHPAQVTVVHDTLQPSEDEIERARRIVEAAEAAAGTGQGVATVDGLMIDRPVIVQAVAVLGRIGETVQLSSVAASPVSARAASTLQPPRATSGRWFEELSVGDVVHHAVTRTLTEADNTFFTALTMNPQPLHLDADFAADTEFGQRLVNSMLTLAVLVGVSVYELTLGTTVANLGFGLVEFPAPAFHGDTLRAETEVLESRASRSRPEAGIVSFEHRGYNQHGQLIARCQRQALMHRGPAAPAPA